MEIEKLNINVIKPYWRNPRNGDNAVGAVKASIERYGFNQPLIVDTDNTIIAGHTRYKALRELGWEEIPVIKVDLPAEKAKEYRIADNKTSELAGWDNNLLIPELREIIDLEDFSVFFPDEDLSRLIDPSSGIKVQTEGPTQEQIDRQAVENVTAFEQKVAAKNAELIDIICPACGHEFQMPPDKYRA